MRIVKRINRHARLSLQAVSGINLRTPPFLILFVNSACNLKCGHCFYWNNLNKKDDLSFEEIITFARDYGTFENLNLSGGEPFIRGDVGEICRFFVRNNRVKQIYIPTNAYYPDKIEIHVLEILKEPALELLAVEISLDGMPEYHNRLRGNRQSFNNAMTTYRVLERLQIHDERLKIHANTTIIADNTKDVKVLTKYLYDNCPGMDHHNIAIIRGDRKDPSLKGPTLEVYMAIYAYVEELWKSREGGRPGSVVEPLLQWAKDKTIKAKNQVIPCMAGKLSAVVYANGEVGMCESLPPLGNLRTNRFYDIWYSPEAQRMRQSIKRKECYCTNEIFMWPSITFQPLQLLRAFAGSKIYRKF